LKYCTCSEDKKDSTLDQSKLKLFGIVGGFLTAVISPIYTTLQQGKQIVDEPAFGHQILFQIWVKQFTMCEVYLD